ncbi:tRNA lysidine(34) synthetase TilS [Calorimonas adulescens]|jgi:tRNA(Ile)-lysidine synthetase, N-terminal domain/tRNA(Ile)-lysidine synthetase, C-terminal domain|uniref:tRNA(Ile)-lysidine synthase n=1 Tax=Calorimonas adulescens TaxID=2606906 RepID=A0A5D8QA04_9THEO|nr:tRNA lysidine(34) synthetase TilS [Calorimonas adulescens]TZE81585.1 tRNA lysidine(34) synthetase TilS [Calorimonas adulescens]
MEDKVIATIKKYNMLEKGDGVVVGVSGGPDSLCLLYILYSLKETFDLNLYVAHVNHGIRGTEADEDAIFVEKIAGTLGLPFFVRRVNVPEIVKKTGLSSELVGRNVRYEFFNEIALKKQANRIAVAHNKNDLAETFLLHLIRGSGTTGLVGIRPVNGKIIRPLIEVSRSEIEEYLSLQGIEPRIDATNYEAVYDRNRVRLRILPAMEEINPDVVDSIARTATLLREDEEFFEDIVLKFLNDFVNYEDGRVTVEIQNLLRLPISIRNRVIRYAVKLVKGNYLNLGLKNVEDVVKLALKCQTGSSVDLPDGLVVEVSYGKIIFRNSSTEKVGMFYYEIEPGREVFIPEIGTVLKTELLVRDEVEFEHNRLTAYIDFDKVKNGLAVRNRRPGDRIAPLGMTGTKKLKELFIDNKIPKEKRDHIPLIVDGDEVVWAAGVRLSERYKVDRETKNVLRIVFSNDIRAG